MAGETGEQRWDAGREPRWLLARLRGWWPGGRKAGAPSSGSHTDQFDAVFSAELNQLCGRHAIRTLPIRETKPALDAVDDIEARSSAHQVSEAAVLAEAYTGAAELRDVSPLAADIPLQMQTVSALMRDLTELKSADPERRRGMLSGLALSGGGIRSAAFACGVLEALARNRRLESFDYLSTVSGGGYAGTALTWALHQNPGRGANDFADFRVAESQSAGQGWRRAETAAPEIRLIDYIRRRAKYLAPTDDLSLLSGLLNTLRMSLASFLIYAVVTVATILPVLWGYYWAAETQCVEQPFPWMPGLLRTEILNWASYFDNPCFAGLSLIAASGIAGLFVATFLLHVLVYAFWPSFEATYASRLSMLRKTTRLFSFALAGFVLALLPLVHSYKYAALTNPLFYMTGIGALGISGLSTALSLVERLGERARALLLRVAAFFLFFALLLGAFAVAHWIVRAIDDGEYWFFAPDSALAIGDTAFAAILGGVAGALLAVAVMKFVNRRAGRNIVAFSVAVMMIAVPILFSVIAQGMASVMLPDLDASFYVPLLRLLGVLGAIFLICTALNPNSISSHRFYRDRLMETFMPSRQADSYAAADEARLCDMFSAARGDGTMIRPGAGDTLVRDERETISEAKSKYRAPYHILNANVILVASNQPKYYQRGGDSFILSPLFCGSMATGWIATERHSVRLLQSGSNFQLATAMAISGAAANPNTAGGEDAVTRRWSISFLMTLLNIRLGSWQPNPARRRIAVKQETTPPPSFLEPGVYSLIRGYFDERRPYVELSDGGHFDNTGLYELFRRRVGDIVLADASCDPDYSLDDLARALALAHVDFGVTVTFQQVRARDSAKVWRQLGIMPGQPGAYRGKGYPFISDGVRAKLLQDGFATATITYPARPGEPVKQGSLVYLKPALVADAPVELLSYALNNADFPHQATSDQFFSERRFESYRRLGDVIGQRMCETVLA